MPRSKHNTVYCTEINTTKILNHIILTLNSQVISGLGYPLATQVKVTFLPIVTTSFSGLVIKCGVTEIYAKSWSNFTLF